MNQTDHKLDFEKEKKESFKWIIFLFLALESAANQICSIPIFKNKTKTWNEILIRRNGKIKNNKWVPKVRQDHMGWVYGNKMNHDINRVGVIWWCYRTFHYYLHLRLNRVLLMDILKIRDMINQKKKSFLWCVLLTFVDIKEKSSCFSTTTLFDFIMSCCCFSAFYFVLLYEFFLNLYTFSAWWSKFLWMKNISFVK